MSMHSNKWAIGAMIVSVLLGAGVGHTAPSPTLKRVVVSTAGIGFFEYEALVSNAAQIDVSVPLAQIDDILKSLVVYDPANKIEDVRLQGREPLQTQFSEQRLTPDALGNPVSLLQSVRGAEIIIETPRRISGRLMSVVPETITDDKGRQITQNRLSIATAQGIQQVVLEQAEQVRFADPDISKEIERTLKAVFDDSAKDRRTLHIGFGAGGVRTIRFAYTVAMPLWKTSYRLTPIDDRRANLQGWAILENMSGVPWENVDLSLVSGNPVALKQALYQSYYVPRTSVPVDIVGQKPPQADQGSVAYRKLANRQAALEADGAMMAEKSIDAAAPAMMANAMMAAPGMMAPTEITDVPTNTENSAHIFFHFDHPVSVASGGSLMVPIIQRDMKTARVALYQPATNPQHPLSSFLLVNEGGASLPPGIVTFFDRDPKTGMSFGGDAKLQMLPAGDERFLSFAVDQKVTINTEQQADQLVQNVRFVDGVLEVSTAMRQKTIYRMRNIDDVARMVVLEQPREAGWELITPAAKSGDDTVRITDKSWRFSVSVPAGQEMAYEVVMTQPISQRYDVTEIDDTILEHYTTSTDISEAVRAVFAKLAALKANIRDAENRMAMLEQNKNEIAQEQERLRTLLQSVPAQTDLYKRYITGLNQEEDKIQRIRTQQVEVQEEIQKTREEMLKFVRTLPDMDGVGR